MRNRSNHSHFLRLGFARLALVLLMIPASAWPLLAEESEDGECLTLKRIFDSSEFTPKSLGSPLWLKDRAAYTVLEKDDWNEEQDDEKDDEETKEEDKDSDDRRERGVVRYEAESGAREVLVPARLLIPSGESSPLTIDGYAWSDDGSKLLITTNSKRVWRKNTLCDYWVLDVSARELRKLGGSAAPSSTMFAKFSPDGRQVAYVCENNIYVEDLGERRITQLTDNGSDIVINGTFDWVYEEELGLRDGIRWSPDSRRIAYWQLNSEGVREIYLINHTDSVYPQLKTIKYPKVGERNSASRVGVVNAQGGETLWLDVPGDPRNHYIARMDWAKSSEEIVIQQLNRLQNTNRVMLADAGTGRLRTILTERDDAWVELHGDIRWIDDDKEFLWLSERDGWQHAYIVSRSGENVRLVTPGGYDVTGLCAVDEASKWLYFMASPDNPSQRYLYRVRLDGSDAQRVTPADQSGTHSYQISDDTR
ncbi:MAG: DPP IV N-terminal domain-containing protein, partial [Bythopirellula sp.]